MVSFENIKEKDLKKLKQYGFDFTDTKSKHELVRLKGKSTLVHILMTLILRIIKN